MRLSLAAALLAWPPVCPIQERVVRAATSQPQHPAPPRIEQMQAADGHWAAGGEDPRRDLGATALAVLAGLADGATLDSSQSLRSAVRWLVRQQAADGSFGPAAAAAPAEDQALATLALVESVGLSAREELRPAAQRALAGLLDRLRRAPAPDAAVATAWAALAVDAGRDFGLGVDAKAVEDLWPRGAWSDPAPGQEREGAALLLARAALRGDEVAQVAALREAAARLLDRPALRADPVAVWFVSWALFARLTFGAEGAQLWRRWQRELLAQAKAAPATASRPAPSGVSTAYGEVGSAALAELTMTLVYRYCRLAR